ncbi:MAG TPA: glycosyltransferase family 1 protein [Saprospiraceae bacterium]|nr:glycosyltransferase family 1 protein [Saprospiraceae bacterium]HMP23575.1 glycosyltransferase family 1 protein [Saprospiraceae bacterium]
MRIAVNTRFLLKDKLEGIGWFTYEVLRRLVQQYPEHEFIFLFDRPYDASFIFGDNVQPVVLIPPARHPLLWLWWFELSVPRALRQYRADVFLSPDGHCSLRTRMPTVMVTHDIAYAHIPDLIPAKFRWYYRWFLPRHLRRADRIVTVSEYSRQDIARKFELPVAKITVACNAARPDFRPLSAAEKEVARQSYAGGEPYFLYLGSVHPRKNVARLIQAFDAFKQETGAPIKLLIGGRLAWQTEYVQAAHAAAVHQEAIVFLGFVPDAALPRLVGGALALAYVSLFEGFGVPLLEAMHCDVPVITSSVTSMPEVAGQAALLVNPLDVFEIAKAMQNLYESPDLQQELMRQGRIQRERFSWDRAAAVVWQAINDVAW